VRALREAGFEVRAIVGRNRARVAERAAPLGIPLATDSLDEALADPKSLLVTVATPPHAHYPFVMQAIAAGRHVLCEKPFAKDTAEAREMLAAAERAGVVHMLGAELRFEASQALLRRVVRQGLIGQPRHFLRLHYQPGLQDPSQKLADWWEDASQGGGWLGAFAPHMIDQVQTTVGRITRVSAILQKLTPGRPTMTAEDTFTFQFETAEGASGTIAAAASAPGPLLMSTRVVGSEGGAWIQEGASWGEPQQVWVANAEGQRQIETPADLLYPNLGPFPVADLVQTEMDRWHSTGLDVPPYARLFTEMRRRISGAAVEAPEVAATFRDAAQGQAVMDAIRRAAAEKRWVEVEQV